MFNLIPDFSFAINSNFIPNPLDSQSSDAIYDIQFDIHKSMDELLLSKYEEKIISGYLNLNESQGWVQGGPPDVGAAFTRFILVNYFTKYRREFRDNESLIKRVIFSFKNIIKNFPVQKKLHPNQSKSCYDANVTGWKNHCITRILGNLGSYYDKNKPFFEMLINSQASIGNPICSPFHVSIFENEQEAEERRASLSSLSEVPSEIASYVFYTKNRKHPNEYLQENRHRLGPNSTRTLEGLSYLEEVKLPAQKSGNCWIKQPMRALLAVIFIEIMTKDKQIRLENAWENAKNLYKFIHKSEGIPYVENLVKKISMTEQMKQSALEAISYQKTL